MEPIGDDPSETELPSDTATEGDEEDDFLITFGRVIRDRRMRKGLSRERAAQRLKVSVESLKRAERGGNPTLKMFFNILRGLDLDPFEMAGYVIGAKEKVSMTPGKKRSRVPPIKTERVPAPFQAQDRSVQSLEVSRRDPKTTPVRLHAEIRDRRLVTLGDGEVVMLPDDVPQGGTVQVRLTGEDYRGAGIGDGDVLIVSRTNDPKRGALVIAIVGGEIVIGTYRPENGQRRLVAEGKVTELTAADHIYGVIKMLVRQFDQT